MMLYTGNKKNMSRLTMRNLMKEMAFKPELGVR